MNDFEPAPAKAGVYTPTQEDIDATQAAEAQLNPDPFEPIRPIIQAVWATIREMAPMIPNALLGQALKEGEVFRFLVCLEKHGYAVTPVSKDTVTDKAFDAMWNAKARTGEF